MKKQDKPKVVEPPSMDYNTQLSHLILPEHGRNIQRMIDFAMTVKDREERNLVAKGIIQVMGQLNPHLRDVVDFKHKLWDHLFIMSKFKLEVDSPYPLPTPETFESKPERVKYPLSKMRYRHYGKIMEDIIKKAKDIEAGEEKEFLIELIANNLKQSYLIWNRDSVTDDVILNQLEELSDGELKLDKSKQLVSTQSILSRTKINRPKTNNNPKSNHGKNHGHGRNFKRHN